jgi:uncharacterized protein
MGTGAVERTAVSRLGWTDLATLDFDASRGFLEELFGWVPRSLGLADLRDYSLLLSGGQPVAAIDPIPSEKGPSRWTVFVLVENCPEALDRIEGEGGATLLAPIRVGEQGTLALAKDVGGVEFGLWCGDRLRPPPPRAASGLLAGATLLTPEPERAAEFYCSALGWAPLGATPRERAIALDAGGLTVTITADRDRAEWTPSLGTDDLEHTVSKAIELGGRLEERDPSTATVVGPEGARFGLRLLQQRLPN